MEIETNLKELPNKQFRFCCELIWGGVPVDKDWVLQSKLFIEMAPKILERYPKLDKSFFEEIEGSKTNLS